MALQSLGFVAGLEEVPGNLIVQGEWNVAMSRRWRTPYPFTRCSVRQDGVSTYLLRRTETRKVIPYTVRHHGALLCNGNMRAARFSHLLECRRITAHALACNLQLSVTDPIRPHRRELARRAWAVSLGSGRHDRDF